MSSTGFEVDFALFTDNPLNGGTGNSKIAGVIRSRKRRTQRETTRIVIAAHVARAGGASAVLPAVITVTRIAPSNGLDVHDGLGAALKGVIDGITDGLALKSDRTMLIDWRLAQRRGRPREYRIEVKVERRTGAST